MYNRFKVRMNSYVLSFGSNLLQFHMISTCDFVRSLILLAKYTFQSHDVKHRTHFKTGHDADRREVFSLRRKHLQRHNGPYLP